MPQSAERHGGSAELTVGMALEAARIILGAIGTFCGLFISAANWSARIKWKKSGKGGSTVPLFGAIFLGAGLFLLLPAWYRLLFLSGLLIDRSSALWTLLDRAFSGGEQSADRGTIRYFAAGVVLEAAVIGILYLIFR